jgi:hypothetical protein
MRIFYFIAAHKFPLLLKRLIDNIAGENDVVCIHVDKKVDIENFKQHINESEQIFFLKNRFDVIWSGFSQVEATIAGMRAFLNHDSDYFVFLSGQDFPVKPTNELKDFLIKNTGRNFIACTDISENWPEAANRIKHYYFVDDFAKLRVRFEKFHGLIDKIEGLVNKVQSNVNRRLPANMRLNGGASWFMLNREAVSYIIEKSDKDLQLYKFFKRTICADELYFQTVLSNSDLKSTISAEQYRFVKFRQGRSNPEVLNLDDYNNLCGNNYFFARKFEETESKALIEKLEKSFNV